MAKHPTLLSIVFILLLCTKTNAQTPLDDSIKLHFELYKKKQITAEDYLKKVRQHVNGQFAKGVLFEREELVRILEPVKQVAWSADSLATYRINYYISLSNNANYANREGESIYYLEKAEKEVNAYYKQRSLMVAGQKCNTYLDKRNYAKVIETYASCSDYLREFPTLIEQKLINLNIGASYINVLQPTLAAYVQLRDTTQVEATLQLAEKIHDALTQVIKPEHQNMLTINFYQQYLYFHKYFTLLNNQQESANALKKMEAVLFAPDRAANALIGHLLPTLYTAKSDFFLHYNLNDSAAYYIEKLKSDAVDFGEHYYTINRMEARLLANRGQYRQAYDVAVQAARHIDSIQSVLVNDIDEMLYAHTAAEENRALLLEAEEKERQRNAWIALISAIALLGFLSFYLYYRKKQKKTQQLLSKLNQEANLQVAVLQEIKTTIRTEEQQKLAQDLHDNLAGTLATIKNNIAHLDDGAFNKAQQENLELALALLGKAYQQTRDKSHHLHEQGLMQQDDAYIEHLHKLIQTALPPSRYETHVSIDEGTLIGTSIDLRITILRMIQELLTNIIKHAQAQKVHLAIYKEIDLLYIHIENDGKSFDPDKVSTVKTLGLHSIRERLKGMKGSIEIVPKGIGTETTISIPYLFSE